MGSELPTSPCVHCGAAVTPGQRFCPSCGTSLDSSDDSPTSTAPRGSRRETAPDMSRPGARPAERFPVGTLLAGRYRILGLAGRGGMGEVYRAEDVKLDQSVALKLLPEGLEDDRGRLERLFSEVRTARQVSHPAVCRVWDIGEVDRHHFLTMEYVDGENLSSLLRRIGRLPEDKAIEIAEQVCAGIAAAHAKGVIHRDLKPANIMLDGQGKVRITDFGLAGLADSFRGSDLRSGTPAFMAPEQLQGREVTFRSDIYSLGLVLYELFTGRRAFEGRTEAELARKQRDENPIDPSAIVHDLPPAVERTILACIHKNPRRRPPSALAVAAMLRGRDPLEAAIAAGDTPSPELVAAAGEMESPATRLAWAGLIAAVVGAVLAPALLAPFHVVNLVPPELPPVVLEHRAREILTQLGHTAHAVDSTYDLDVDNEYFDSVRRSDARPRNWSALRSGRPAVARFWYRESPRPLAARATSGDVRWSRPPIDISGMAGVALDLKGRLLQFYSVPPQRESEAQPSPPPDWTPLLEATGLDPAELEPVAPEWTPPFYVETRAAWLAHWPDRPDIPIRLEAAAHRGRVVSLQIIEPWTRASRMQPYEPTRAERLTGYLAVALLLLLIAVGAALARYNLRLGRGDRRGAARLVLLLLGLGLTNVLLVMHHVAAVFEEILLLARATAMSVFIAMLLWLFYLALEPLVRRQRPRVLVSWNRLVGGGYRDAVVGRDALAGVVWGVAAAGVYGLAMRLPERLGYAAPEPLSFGLVLLQGLRPQLAMAASLLLSGVLMGLGSLLLYLVLRLALRRDALATVALVLVLATLGLGQNLDPLWLWGTLRIFVMASYVFLLLRLGLVAAIVGTSIGDLLMLTPVTVNLGAWYAQPTYVAVVAVGVLAVLAFRTTLGGVGARLRALSGDSHSRG